VVSTQSTTRYRDEIFFFFFFFLKRKLDRAMDFYQLQLQYAEQLYELAKKEAYDSFQAQKAEQREYMWRIKLEREITLRLLRLSSKNNISLG
jgi:hypothetical protein